jgi:hypothetical protein
VKNKKRKKEIDIILLDETREKAGYPPLFKHKRSWFSTYNELIGMACFMLAGVFIGMVSTSLIGTNEVSKAKIIYDNVLQQAQDAKIDEQLAVFYYHEAVDTYLDNEKVLKQIRDEKLKLYAEARFIDRVKEELMRCGGKESR